MTEVKHLDWRTLMSAKDDTPAETITALDKYFEPFAQPVHATGGEILCIECSQPLTGLLSSFLGGGFEWGIVHGEGHCGGCRWPARAHHFIKDENGSEVITVQNFVLQFHPDFVTRRALSKAS